MSKPFFQRLPAVSHDTRGKLYAAACMGGIAGVIVAATCHNIPAAVIGIALFILAGLILKLPELKLASETEMTAVQAETMLQPPSTH